MSKTIKSLNEYFSQTLTGDGYNSSNGVFKVNYKPFTDLSVTVGRDPDPSILIKDSRFQVGDFVKGNVRGRKKTVTGEIIEVFKAQDGKSYTIKIQSTKDKKNYTLIPGSIDFVEDRGNTTNSMGMQVNAREKMAQNAKYNGGNIVWGSLEGIDNSDLINPNKDGIISGPMGTGWKIKLVDELPSGETLLNSAVADPINALIHCLRSNDSDILKNVLKSIESFCFINYHPELEEIEKEIKLLMSILFLELKNEQEAKKNLIQNFPSLSGRSYGESRDENLEKATDIINKFL